MVILSKIGKIVLTNWKKISSLHNYSELDEFVIIPKHIHCIIIIDGSIAEDVNFASSMDRTKMTLCKVIQQFNHAITIYIRKMNSNCVQIWQQSFLIE